MVNEFKKIDYFFTFAGRVCHRDFFVKPENEDMSCDLWHSNGSMSPQAGGLFIRKEAPSMHKKRIVLAFVTGWTLGLAGCALLTHKEQITALKSLGGEQRNIEKYVQQQEKFFNKLKSDFQNQRLVKGTSKVKILSLYGEPIYCKGSHESHETCLYRHPTRYFSGERIFLEFDQDQNLSFWEAKSCF